MKMKTWKEDQIFNQVWIPEPENFKSGSTKNKDPIEKGVE